MPFNGSGVYELTNPPPFIFNTTISESEMNACLTDIKNALSTVLVRDGQAAMTGTFNMGSQSIISIGAGSAANPSVRWSAGNGFYEASGGIGLSLGGALKWFTDSAGRFLNSGNTQPVATAQVGSQTSSLTPVECVNWGAVTNNRGSCFNATTGRFTAPVAGAYFVSAVCTTTQAVANGSTINVRKNGAVIGGAYMANRSIAAVAGAFELPVTGIVVLAASDYISIFQNVGNASNIISGADFHVALLY